MKPAFWLALLGFVGAWALQACGTDTASGATQIAQQDCTALFTLNQLCNLGLTQDYNACVTSNASKSAVCRAATHSYVQCMSKLTCQAILSDSVTPCAAQQNELIQVCPSTQTQGAQATVQRLQRVWQGK